MWDVERGLSTPSGPYRQVSRLGNPLVNEVLIPLGKKDFWNTQPPMYDSDFATYVTNPELARLLPALYPGVFPHLAALDKSGKARADLEAILLTGIPAGLIKGFQNHTGSVLADMLRLNTAIKPSPKPNILGVLGGDLAGFPNGRRVFDDVVTIELRAIARPHLPARRPGLQAGRGSGRDHRWAHPQGRGQAVPAVLPVPGRALRRLLLPLLRWRVTESSPGPSGPGTVVLDIGDDVGALIVITPAAKAGEEIHVSPVRDPAGRTHAAVVRERRLGRPPVMRRRTRPSGPGSTPSGATRTGRPGPSASMAGRSPATGGRNLADAGPFCRSRRPWAVGEMCRCTGSRRV